MQKNNLKDGRIFISYRRSDAKGYAGRLEDSLEEYFGNNRVFRDIDDIKGGAAFGEVIKENIRDADAIVILIGQTWLSAIGKDNTPRLFDPGDWVAEEIASAIELGIPLFPVLIEGTPMPRAEEIPEKLYPILQYNAGHISDKSWNSDVLRLAKVLAFDIPSVNERKVNFAKIWSSIFICITMVFSTCCLFWNFYHFIESPYERNNTYELWKDGENYKSKVIDQIKNLNQNKGYRVFKEKRDATKNVVTGIDKLDKIDIESLGSQGKVVLTREEIDTLKGQDIVVLSEERFESIKGQDIIVLSEERFESTKDQGIVVISREGFDSRKNDKNFVVLTKSGLFESNGKYAKAPIINLQDSILEIKDSRDIVIIPKEQFDSLKNKEEFKELTLQEFNLLDEWQIVPPIIGMIISMLLIFNIIPLIDKERQKYLFACVYTGAIGGCVILSVVYPISEPYETMWIYSGFIIVTFGILVFMNMSGFKVK